MNCGDFQHRMQMLLDGRLPVQADGQLRRHAEQCPPCRDQLRMWSQIAATLPSGVSAEVELPSQAARLRSRIGTVAALAAVLLCAITALQYDARQADIDEAIASTPPIEQLRLAQAAEVDPALWWQGMQSTDWIGQTMPTVMSVQEGVAPLGRSLMRAVTILTLGTSDKTS